MYGFKRLGHRLGCRLLRGLADVRRQVGLQLREFLLDLYLLIEGNFSFPAVDGLAV